MKRLFSPLLALAVAIPYVLASQCWAATTAQQKQVTLARIAVIRACDKESADGIGHLVDSGVFTQSEVADYMLNSAQICKAVLDETYNAGTVPEVRAVGARMHQRFIDLAKALVAKVAKEQKN